MNTKPRTLVLAVLAALPGFVHAEDTAQLLEEVIVTAPLAEEPLTVTTNPKAPRQPVPAHDGADYLKTIPGFSLIRKGGTDGDPVLRGMAGSRLNILLDGEQILGGCGNRMDPPTAYVFPESYDRITVLKGPQTVLYGPGNSAGTVLFERSIKRFEQPGWKFNGSLTAGSFGRNDQVADIRAGSPDFYFQGTGTRSDAGDYEDGDGRLVHSAYTRWSTSAAVGWTPDDSTRLELSATASDGEAAYADRSMDGARFERENYGLKFEKSGISTHARRIEGQIYHNYIDHVMDNYSLRAFTASMMMPNPAVSNPDRETDGGHVTVDLRLGDATTATLGIDYQTNQHTNRSTMNQTMMPYENLARSEDANFRNQGLFGEITRLVGEQNRLIGGLRADRWHAQDQRATIAVGMMSSANPTANQERDETLASGFARWERDLADTTATLYAGLGRTERFPDYWELISKESASSLSAFDTRPEKTTQLDVGLTHRAGRLKASVSGFYGEIDDFILIQSNYVKGMRTATIARNVDATTWGGELGANYALADTWKLDGSLAYVRGDNDTDGAPLAQLPPLEGRVGLTWDNRVWSVGSLLRLVSEQDRFDIDKGNIVGQDIGRTAGFGVFSLNASYRPREYLQIAAGVDNLFDRTYAEHISRAGAAVTGFTQTTRVNEPGRLLWVKLNVALN